MDYYERNVQESLSQPGQATRWELVDDIVEQIDRVMTATTPAIRSRGLGYMPIPRISSPRRAASTVKCAQR